MYPIGALHWLIGTDNLSAILATLRFSFSAHMDMKTTGASQMGRISHGNSLGQDITPRHFVQMIIQRHGVADNFKTVLQRSVMLAENVFQPVGVGNVHEAFSVAVDLAAANLQLYAHESRAISIENRIGLEIVIMDASVRAVSGMAVVAIGLVIVIIVGIAFGGRSATT